LAGALAGGTVGCNYQISSMVLGVENDLSWTNKGASSPDMPPFSRGAISSTNEKWIDTLRGRVGWAWDRFLVYGTAGAAFTGVDVGVCSPTAICISDSRTRTGWSAGVGGEWAVWTVPAGSATLKIEYLHADFGTGLFCKPAGRGGGEYFQQQECEAYRRYCPRRIELEIQLVNPRPAEPVMSAGERRENAGRVVAWGDLECRANSMAAMRPAGSVTGSEQVSPMQTKACAVLAARTFSCAG
jgi:hypothetical protein